MSADRITGSLSARIASPAIYKLRTRYFGKALTPKRLRKMFPVSFGSSSTFFQSFKQGLRERFFLSDLNRKEFYINLITSLGDFDSILDDADLVHENKFQALGSIVYSFGKEVDWHLDFKTGRRWEPEFYAKIEVETPGDPSDVRVPWQLSRFHQAIWLGKAYWLSRSESHTEKFKELVRDWIEKNPVGFGVNWYSAAEAAIRAMNLVVGLLYFMNSAKIDERFLFELICSLYEHGVYIRYNLRGKPREVVEYIYGLVGLIYLGMLFYDSQTGKAWVEFARRQLELEVSDHIGEGGTMHGNPTACHRGLTESIASAYVLLKLNRFPVSDEFIGRIEKMFLFLASATMRDGTVPELGDVDDTHIFRMKPNSELNDHRDVLAVGAALFGKSELREAAGSFSELALLLLGGEGFERFSRIPGGSGIPSSVYREAGLAFLRTDKDFASFNFGRANAREGGAPARNEMLGFTIAGKNRFIVNRGTYSRNRNSPIRNRLRSTYSHNTIVIDRSEQTDRSSVRSMADDAARPELLKWLSTENQDIVEAQHHAYERIARSVTHRRTLTLNKRQRTFRVEDDLLGEGRHSVEMMFHFAPGLRVVDLGRNFLALEGEEFALMKFQYPFTLENWDHSPEYGVLRNARTARVSLETDLPLRIETFIFITSNEDDMNYLLNRIQSSGPPE